MSVYMNRAYLYPSTHHRAGAVDRARSLSLSRALSLSLTRSLISLSLSLSLCSYMREGFISLFFLLTSIPREQVFVRSCARVRPLSNVLTHLYSACAECLRSCLCAGARALSLSLTQINSIMGHLPWCAGAGHRRLRDLCFVYVRGGAFADR